MALKIVGAGFGRTGTLSLKTALEQLGYVRCHHMQAVPGSAEQVDAWLAAARGEAVDWDAVFDGFEASCDWPSCRYWKELHEYYPDSVVILTTRDAERWYDSVAETIYVVSHSIPRWLTRVAPRVRRLQDMIFRTVWSGTFDDRFEDRDYAIGVYERHIEDVERHVAPERLLVFEAKDGWEPLCAFLGVPVPETPYPHVNDAATIKRLLPVIRVIRWLPLALLAAVLAITIAVWR